MRPSASRNRAMLERISASPRNATVLVRLTMTAASVAAVTRWSAQPCIRQRTFCCIMADGHRSDPGPCGSFSTHPVRRRRRALSTQRSLNPSERFPPGQPKPTELTTHARLKKPAVRQIEVDLVAQPPFGANAEAVADNEHPDHQLRIDRRATHLTIKRLQRLAEVIEGEMSVNAPEHVIDRDVFLKAEIIEQPRRRSLKAHHRVSPANQRDSMNHDAPLTTINRRLHQRYPQLAAIRGRPSKRIELDPQGLTRPIPWTCAFDKPIVDPCRSDTIMDVGAWLRGLARSI